MIAMGLKDSNCSKGKPCSAACIQRTKVCRVELPLVLQNFISKARETISANSKHVADHVGKGMTAWKTGKVVGTAISSYLENRYGLPRETSLKLAEVAVQGITATALDIKAIKNTDQFAKKLVSELVAAFVGKTSHAGVESFLASKEVETTLNTVLPILAGKISGIGATITASKLPNPRSLFNQLVSRSNEDISKIRNLIQPTGINFQEPAFPVSVMGDLTLVALYIVDSLERKV